MKVTNINMQMHSYCSLFVLERKRDTTKDESTKYKFQTEHKYFMIIHGKRNSSQIALSIKSSRMAAHQNAALVFFSSDFFSFFLSLSLSRQTRERFSTKLNASLVRSFHLELHSKCIQCARERKMDESNVSSAYDWDYHLSHSFNLFLFSTLRGSKSCSKSQWRKVLS